MSLVNVRLLFLSIFIPLYSVSALGSEDTFSRAPYLQSVTGRSALVLWKTEGESRGIVEVWKGGGWKRSRERSASEDHVIRIRGLSPGKRYRYRVLASSGAILHSSSFHTAPNPSTKKRYRVALFGDSGTESTAQVEIATAMAAWKPHLVLHTGDIIYNSGEAELYDARFFTPYASMLSKAPIFPVPGNHDVITPAGFLNAFYLPASASGSGSERYYSFDYGNAHFVVVDSNEALGAGSAQRVWLESDLGGVSSSRWKIVLFHHPPFSAGHYGDNSTLQTDLVPLLESSSIDLVFNGHNHAFERSNPISLGGTHSVTYVVTGGGGASLYQKVGENSRMARYQASYHYIKLLLSKKTLEVRATTSAGVTIDSFTLNR